MRKKWTIDYFSYLFVYVFVCSRPETFVVLWGQTLVMESHCPNLKKYCQNIPLSEVIRTA